MPFIKNYLKKYKPLRKFVIQLRALSNYTFGGENKTLDEKIPWMGKDSIEWLKQYLKKDMTVFEWGSGGSTLFMAKRVKKVISIEHNYDWFLKTQVYLKLNRISNCQYQFVSPEKGTGAEYNSADKNYQGQNFEKYCRIIDSFPEENFNLIFIDGRARSSCILRAKDKVKIGGYLLSDNLEREEYSESINLLKDWKKQIFTNQVQLPVFLRSLNK